MGSEAGVRVGEEGVIVDGHLEQLREGMCGWRGEENAGVCVCVSVCVCVCVQV